MSAGASPADFFHTLFIIGYFHFYANIYSLIVFPCLVSVFIYTYFIQHFVQSHYIFQRNLKKLVCIPN